MNMNHDQRKARVFVSCGQRSNTEEVYIASKIKELLEAPGLDFDVYVADHEHTQWEVAQAVLNRLENSEYFLFIDFKREEIVERDAHGGNSQTKWRGSLFSHQELAIATFLKIEPLRFQEKGVEVEGIAKLLQGRPIEFEDRGRLPEDVVAKVQERWRSGWQNGLRIVQSPGIDCKIPRSHGCTADFYHIVVENLHNRKLAMDCRAFVELVPQSCTTPPAALCEQLEQKWAGTIYSQAVAIRPNHGQRRACACYVGRHPSGQSLGVFFHQFGIDTDSAEAARPCPPGEYLLKFTIVSSNFPAVVATFNLVIDHQHEISEFIASRDE